jgi:hypothetical protein
MADEIENKEDQVDQPDTKVKDQPDKVELTAVEQKAMDEGWVPKDEWEGDPDQWRPAKEFVDRGELFKKIEDQNRTIKEFKRTLDDLKMHHSKVRETEYKRALEALKEQKKTAIADGDGERVVELDDQIDLVKDEQRNLNQPKPQERVDSPNPEFTAWMDRNKWYQTKRPMKAFADDLGRELAARGNSPSEVLKEVERQVKQEFPNEFRNPNRDKPNAVEGSSGKGSVSKDTFVLTDTEKEVMNRFVRGGVITKEKYIEDLKATRGA